MNKESFRLFINEILTLFMSTLFAKFVLFSWNFRFSFTSTLFAKVWLYFADSIFTKFLSYSQNVTFSYVNFIDEISTKDSKWKLKKSHSCNIFFSSVGPNALFYSHPLDTQSGGDSATCKKCFESEQCEQLLFYKVSLSSESWGRKIENTTQGMRRVTSFLLMHFHRYTWRYMKHKRHNI